MPSRRSVLTASGAVTVASTLAGCAIGTTAGTPATHANRTLQPQDASVVAGTGAELRDCPQGGLLFRARAYDTGQDELVVWTRVRVIPGRNRTDCESDWVQTGVDMVHDWSDLRPDGETGLSWAANVVPTDKASPEYNLRNTSDTRHARWQIRTRGSAAESTALYEFRSTFGPANTIGDGDDLAELTVEVPVESGSLFGDSETFSLTPTLTYGNREA